MHFNILKPLRTFILIVPILFIGCEQFSSETDYNSLSYKEDFRLAKVEDRYQMYLPKFMKSTNDLNEDASLQFKNELKETYTILIDETNEEAKAALQMLGSYKDSISMLENYIDFQKENLTQDVEVISLKEPLRKRIDGMPAMTFETTIAFEEIIYPVSYHVTVVEAKESLFMIMSWTLKSRKKKYFPYFEKASNSLEVFKARESEVFLD
ncbi:hypothetical protein ACFQ1M_01600 [Sungkyunkwania multivorans]|uniref:Uncharacterized protein n=1 Tax=Sungkyunkwania multivorans TaxID=1173618 RepID=A0ABW3CT90_9FLAO